MSELFPSIEPFARGYLDVGDGHSIYFEECGNPDGHPILFFHGGPGAGCDKDDRRKFDPKKWRVILFDQRGSGRSRPYGCTKNNTTQKLIADAKLLLLTLGIKKTAIFGGSWSSTMSLLFAITYSETVSGMVLRGIFLGEEGEIADYISGRTIGVHFPEAWERLISHVPPRIRDTPLQYYYAQMQSKNHRIRKKFAYEWSRYEYSVLYLNKWKSEEDIDAAMKKFSGAESMGILEVYYIMNNCFLEDGYIMRNLKRIQQTIPISIVQGRYDVICPPISAWRLAKALPQAKLHMVCAGHSSGDPEIQRLLISETNSMYKKITRSK